ncbi:hypothetical protein NDU88_005258 [Pleurodeles waltl]|uniref:Uncharacterized protein n=1 Tax=Pleurodeles waltl TaxID=8319 RepID=A0AAV7UHI7_PLEWA|nr:hypothetical protein NDU88_005258 [Pleurodeles waltl]
MSGTYAYVYRILCLASLFVGSHNRHSLVISNFCIGLDEGDPASNTLKAFNSIAESFKTALTIPNVARVTASCMWFDKACSPAHRALIASLNRQPHNGHEVRRARTNYRGASIERKRTLKRELWNKLLQACALRDSMEIWRAITHLLFYPDQVSIQALIIIPQAWLDHFGAINDLEASEVLLPEDQEAIDLCFQWKEVRKAIMLLPDGKALGPDSEVELEAAILTQHFNAAISGLLPLAGNIRSLTESSRRGIELTLPVTVPLPPSQQG